ncbi:hypothetical protein NM688_g3911 [Phlebia brevispora]|uniref:Uncharacterized protein n=1 Tax=Phlebia brevispora TaxID=194682 RepID=A0ACC1T4S0_9APHY|nr:hypothetical protein NM688_g3911 [Phlebia brevispora]
MAATDEQHRDPSKMSAPSRTPSGSPLPTPNSSQIRLHDGKGRPRKLSQNGQDSASSVLDEMDPWGSNWHNRSPYDLGSHDRSSPDLSEHSPVVHVPPPARPRRNSLTPPMRHKTTVPSPLSQSTSAVHLASEPLSSHLPRRLSKSRRPFRGLFSSSSDSTAYGSRSAPVTPGDFSNSLGRRTSRTGSLIPPSISSSSASLAPTEKKARRGSILSRIARRFSVMRKSDTSPSLHDSISARQSLSADVGAGGIQAPSQPQRPPLEQKSSDQSKRVPPPSAEREALRASHDTPRQGSIDAQSVVSIDPSFSAVKLHVANPDEPMRSPMQVNTSLPKLDHGVEVNSPERAQHVLDVPLRNSPSPIDMAEYHRIPHTALSVISEGDTYISTPRSKPLTTLEASPMSLPSIPSILSQPNNAPPPVPHDILVTPASPPLPSLPPPTPVSKEEASLPPTPKSTTASSLSTATPTPVAKTVPLPSTASAYQAHASSYATEQTDRSSSFREEERDTVPSEMYSPSSIRAPFIDADSLARASMIVNPPTPMASSLSIAPAPITIPHPSTQPDVGKAVHNSSPKNSVTRTKSRHTETFQLVRSNSGDVQTIGQRFLVEGEHWEVVESPVERSPTKKSRRSERAEGKKRESSSDDSDAQRKRSVHRKSASANDRRPGDHEHSRVSRARSTDTPRHNSSVERRNSAKERHSVEGTRSTQTPIIYGPRSPVSPAGHALTGLERQTSTSASTRPSSEFQPTADLNALKARDNWEMERLWKGRSAIYGTEGVTIPMPRPHISSDSRPTTIMSADLQRASTIPSVGDSTSTLSPVHGSNHTYFVLQAPHQGVHQAQTYSQYPSPPPPVIYTTDTSVPSSGHFHQTALNRSFTDNVPFPNIAKVPEMPPPRPNPLPDLPRMTAYKPPPLPPSLANIGTGTPA